MTATSLLMENPSLRAMSAGHASDVPGPSAAAGHLARPLQRRSQACSMYQLHGSNAPKIWTAVHPSWIFYISLLDRVCFFPSPLVLKRTYHYTGNSFSFLPGDLSKWRRQHVPTS